MVQSLRWPAEWEAHEATWIAWPHERDDWPRKFAPIPWVYGEIVRQLVQSETVHILVNGFPTQQKIRSILHRLGVEQGRVRMAHVPNDRVWMSDSEPMFVKDSDGIPN